LDFAGGVVALGNITDLSPPYPAKDGARRKILSFHAPAAEALFRARVHRQTIATLLRAPYPAVAKMLILTI
jgi:hypothetical protein